jgi:choline dehydrogenase-like flavoprotein
MKRAIVVGTGAGGATAAKELQGHFDVTVLDAGKEFRPFDRLALVERTKRAGLLFNEREIQLVFPAYQVRRAGDGMILINGIGLGGTTTLCTGNALRMDQDLRALGLDLDAEFEEIAREVPISTAHQRHWRPITRRLFDIFQQMGLDPQPTPKMGNYERCAHCGKCVFGCPLGVKWDSRRFLEIALANGAGLERSCRVERVVIRGGRAVGVEAGRGLARRFYPADLVVLAAGGLGTPVILDRSGIACEPALFVDPVLCVAATLPNSRMDRELPMPFVSQRDGFILSPYFDQLSYFFNRAWQAPAGDILSLMIKLADTGRGSISAGRLDKTLTRLDRQRIQQGVELCTEVLLRCGARRDGVFLGTLNAGHPGGMLPLTSAERETAHPAALPANLYVADASLLPRSLGNPPILTIIALAKRVSKLCRNQA